MVLRLEGATNMSFKDLTLFFLFLIFVFFLAFFSLPERFFSKFKIQRPDFFEKPFLLGLDLKGGINLLYQADLSKIPFEERDEVMRGLKEIIERRMNPLGVREPIVQVQGRDRIRVELPGIVKVEEAKEAIEKTPYLEFKELISEEERKEIAAGLSEKELQDLKKEIEKDVGGEIKKEEIWQYLPLYRSTKLTGRYLKRASLDFSQVSLEPQVAIEFNSEGAKIFEELTRKNWHKPLAIFIDDVLISAPIVGKDDPSPQGSIKGGKAVITGDFTLEEAKNLAQNLNAGALPAPIKIISLKTISAILGKEALEKSLFAALIGVFFVSLFMIFVYRFSGFLAIFSLFFQVVLILTLFKLIPVTLTLSGIAGLILFFGMAVDGNILVFERLREEIRQKQSLKIAIFNAFSRAWPAIRDGNLTTLMVCIILFIISSGFVQGFAMTLGLGNIINLFGVMIVSRFLLNFFAKTPIGKVSFLWTR